MQIIYLANISVGFRLPRPPHPLPRLCGAELHTLTTPPEETECGTWSFVLMLREAIGWRLPAVMFSS